MTDRSKLNKLRTACRELLPYVTHDMIRAWRPCRPVEDDLDAEIDAASDDDLQWGVYCAIIQETHIDLSIREAYLHYLDDAWLARAIRHATDLDPDVLASHLPRLAGKRLYLTIQYATDLDPTVRASHLPRLSGEQMVMLARDFDCEPTIASICDSLING